jgi:hypothetical protein
MSELTPTTPTYRKLTPRKLMPPVEHAKKMFMQDKAKMPKNAVLRFFKIFLGDGFEWTSARIGKSN